MQYLLGIVNSLGYLGSSDAEKVAIIPKGVRSGKGGEVAELPAIRFVVFVTENGHSGGVEAERPCADIDEPRLTCRTVNSILTLRGLLTYSTWDAWKART